jgi:hypothetical protein
MGCQIVLEITIFVIMSEDSSIMVHTLPGFKTAWSRLNTGMTPWTILNIEQKANSLENITMIRT